MRGHAQAFDLVVSADTLRYFGDLAEVLAAAAQSLTGGGYFIFTLEQDGKTPTDPCCGYRIQPHGRYCHCESYVRQASERAGFNMKTSTYEALRQEMGKPVAGLVVTLQAAPR